MGRWGKLAAAAAAVTLWIGVAPAPASAQGSRSCQFGNPALVPPSVWAPAMSCAKTVTCTNALRAGSSSQCRLWLTVQIAHLAGPTAVTGEALGVRRSQRRAVCTAQPERSCSARTPLMFDLGESETVLCASHTPGLAASWHGTCSITRR